MERTSTRVKDVAERAQVSVGTVSNVLNEAPWVAPEVRRRVLAAIDELGYVRNDTARRLRTERSSTIGDVIPDIRNPFYTDVVRGAEEASWKHRLSLILSNGTTVLTASEHTFTCSNSGASAGF